MSTLNPISHSQLDLASAYKLYPAKRQGPFRSKHGSHMSRRECCQKLGPAGGILGCKQRVLVAVCADKSTREAVLPAPAVKQGSSPLEKFAFRTADGTPVLAAVDKQDKHYVVTLSVPSGSRHGSADIYAIWGTYRSSPGKWFTPDSMLPAGSTKDSKAGGMRSQLSTSEAEHQLQLKVEAQLAPVYVAFQLELSGKRAGPARGAAHFAVPVGMGVGQPVKYGPSLAGLSPDGKICAINFAVCSRHATAMSLCLARHRHQATAGSKPGGYLEVALDANVNRTGDVWHIRVEGLKDVGSLCYGWRADAEIGWEAGNRFHPGQIMLDPYAPVAVMMPLPEGVNVPPPNKGLPSGPKDNPPALLGSLAYLLEEFHFEDSARPATPLEHSLVLEVDVASLQGGDSSVSADNRGKYLGVLGQLGLIKALNATAVMLTPVTLGGQGLGPFGRAPFSFFAPEPQLASGAGPLAAAQELKELIKGLHTEGIEVYLQVEYCLTGEGWDEDASAISLRGLDAAVYYRSKGVLNCGHAVVRALILDSLRHWARDYDVDGFCFVNAETLTLDRDGLVLDNPPLVEDIANDSELRRLKLIAWSADDSLLPRDGVRGFPHLGTWLERNKRFSVDWGAFFTGVGPPEIASAVATRITGSADLFEDSWDTGLPGGLATGRRPSFGLNSTSYLDGAPLARTVHSILPQGYPFGQDMVLKRSLLFATLMSQGTPVVGADVAADPGLVQFVGLLMQLRLKLAHMLLPQEFATKRDLRWHGAADGSEPDWQGSLAASGVPAAGYLAYSVLHPDGQGLHVAYNPYEGPVPATLPLPPSRTQWRRAVDTSFDMGRFSVEPKDWELLSSRDYTLAGKGALLLVAEAPPPLPKPAATATARKPIPKSKQSVL